MNEAASREASMIAAAENRGRIWGRRKVEAELIEARKVIAEQEEAMKRLGDVAARSASGEVSASMVWAWTTEGAIRIAEYRALYPEATK